MLRFAIAVLAALLVSAACGGASVGTPSQPIAPVDPAGAWQLVAGTVDGQPLALRDDAPVTLEVDGSQVNGRSGCNSYFGQFTLVGGKVTLGNLGGTEMACEAGIMTLETTYLQALGRVEAARMDGATLVLSGSGVELRFDRPA